MSTPDPDWAALYQKHRGAMFGVAHKMLRESGKAGHAEDVVQEAFLSLQANPPDVVENWEALFVVTTKRRAVDLLRSADSRRSGPSFDDNFDPPDDSDALAEFEEATDRGRMAARAWDALAVLDTRHRFVAREYIAHERPRSEVADELGVTPGRVSQMAKTALTMLREELEK